MDNPSSFCILCDKELSKTELLQSLFFCDKCYVPKDEGFVRNFFRDIFKLLHHIIS